MFDITVTFDRIGRNHMRRTLTATVDQVDASLIETALERAVRNSGSIGSRDMTVAVKLGAALPDCTVGTATIVVGAFRSGGSGTFTVRPAEGATA